MSICDYCHYETSEYVTACEHCEQPSRYPNVTIANKDEEKQVINDDYNKALSSVNNSLKPILQNFENSVNDSNAILVRPINEVLTLFYSLNDFHQTFHQRLRSGAIHMSKNGYDENRPSVDAKLFPNYSDRITFAALSLNGLGATGYGGCHMTLKTGMIAHRSTAFKGNSYHILSNENVAVDDVVPKGLRTTWALRKKLAVSKLAHCFGTATKDSDFPSILINDKDFIEIHVFGSISYRTLKDITVRLSDLDDDDKNIANVIKKKIQNWGKSIPDWDTNFTEI